MTQEEKAKAYDEALEIAKKNYITAQDLCEGSQIGVECFKNTLENIFPELKESEDKKIRKVIYNAIKYLETEHSWDFLDDVDILDAYAWLEKEDEKPQGKSALEAIKEEKVDNQNCVKPTDKVEPKFKVGDRIVHKVNKESPFIITEITNDCYKGGTQYEVLIEQQNNFELVPYKFDINSLVPFESKVLVRDNDYDEWRSAFWGHLRQKADMKYDTLRGVYRQCIPYEGNEHLLGKTNDCDNFYKTCE